MSGLDLRQEVTCRLAQWAEDGLAPGIVEEARVLRLSLRRVGVGSAVVGLDDSVVTSAVERDGAAPLTATSKVTSEAEFGRLLDGLAKLLAAPVDESRVTRRQKRASQGPRKRRRHR